MHSGKAKATTELGSDLKRTGPQHENRIVASGGSLQQLAEFSINRGDLFMLIACLIYAIYSLGLSRSPNASSLGIFSIMAFVAWLVTQFQPGDVLLFGSETRGLPQHMLDENPSRNLKLPMREEVRSLNLANAAAILVYEAWRQNDFAGGS